MVSMPGNVVGVPQRGEWILHLLQLIACVAAQGGDVATDIDVALGHKIENA